MVHTSIQHLLVSRMAWAAALALAGMGVGHAQCANELIRYDYSGNQMSYPVTETGYYWIETAGAQGGYSIASTAAGRGAILSGKFKLDEGSELQVRVGQRPASNGGGGASYVVLPAETPQPLIVAGGGGGEQLTLPGTTGPNQHGQSASVGGNGTQGNGGSNGNGGTRTSGNLLGAAAGGGFLSNGADGRRFVVSALSFQNIPNTGGKSWSNASLGGMSDTFFSRGGYGGGGSGTTLLGGGGGGYSGGGSGSGGGGSFNASVEPAAPLTGASNGRTGNGYVRICSTDAPATLTAEVPHFAITGNDYGSVALSVAGGAGPYTWSADDLPDGMSLTSEGVLSGVPVAGSADSYTITVADAYTPFANTSTVALQVIEPLLATAPNFATEGQAYSASLTATGGVLPYTWSATNLHSSLTLSENGELTGTPAAMLSRGIHTITVTDSAEPEPNTFDVTLEIVPAELAITTSSLPGATQGQPYSATLEASGGTSPYSWNGAGLPSGLTVVGNEITGTPTQAGEFQVTLTLEDAGINPTALRLKATQVIVLTLNVQAAAPVAAVPVPTLGEWSIALLAALVAGFGLRQSRRKQRT